MNQVVNTSCPSFPSVKQLLGLFLLCGWIVAPAQDPKVRTHLKVEGTIWTGQKVTLVAELMVPGFFTSAATVDLPNPPGLILMLPHEHPMVSSETVGDVSYTVQRHELSVYAATPGEHTIPPIHARFAYRRGYLDKEDIAGAVNTEPIRFTVTAPPGTEQLGQVISARNLKVVEEWKPQPGKASIKAGDAFTRTITFTAPDLPGMVIPPFPTGQIDGVRIYPKEPAILDHTERGSFDGGRRDVLVYVCERPGRFVIPATRLTWWDLDTQKLRTVDFPSRVLEVAPNPALAAPTGQAAPAAPAASEPRRWMIFAAGGLVLLMAAPFASARFRRACAAFFAPLRPVHLQPLNPEP